MKHRSKDRPIGKCKGCSLNMRTSCAAGMEPKAAWNHGSCRSLNDASVLEAFYNAEPLTGAKAARQRRRRRARQAHTARHYNGQVFAPTRQA